MTSQEESDEEYLDDPIRLIDLEQERVSRVHHLLSNGAETINVADSVDLTESGDESVIESNNPLLKKVARALPVTFFSIPRNIQLFNDCRDVCIKVVNCAEYPWYYKKHFKAKEDNKEISSEESNCIEEHSLATDEEINIEEVRDFGHREINKVPNCNIVNETFSCKDENLIMPPKYGQAVKPKIRPVDYAAYIKKNRTNKTISYKPIERDQYLLKKSIREDIEKEKAMCKKNETEIDFRKNQGLVGLKINHMLDPKYIVSSVKSIRKKKRKKSNSDKKRCESKVHSEVIIIGNKKITNIRDPTVTHDAKTKGFPNSVSNNGADLKNNSPCGMKYDSEQSISNVNKIIQNIATIKFNTQTRTDNSKLDGTEHKSTKNVIHCETKYHEKNKSPSSLNEKHVDNCKSASNLTDNQSNKESLSYRTNNSVKDKKKTNKYLNDQLKARAKSINETTNSGQKNQNENIIINDLTGIESRNDITKTHNDIIKLSDIVKKMSSPLINKDNNIRNTALSNPIRNNNELKDSDINSSQNNSQDSRRNLEGVSIKYKFDKSSKIKKTQNHPRNKKTKELSEHKKSYKKEKSKYSKQKHIDGIAKKLKSAHSTVYTNDELGCEIFNRPAIKPNLDVQKDPIPNKKVPTVGNVKLNSFYVETFPSVTPNILQQVINQGVYHASYVPPSQTSISIQHEPNIVKKTITSNNKSANNTSAKPCCFTTMDTPPLTDVCQSIPQENYDLAYTMPINNNNNILAPESTSEKVKKHTETNLLKNKDNLQSKNCMSEATQSVNNVFNNSHNFNQEGPKNNIPNRETDSCHTNTTMVRSNLPHFDNPLIHRNVPVSQYSRETEPSLNNSSYPQTLPNSVNHLKVYPNSNYVQNQGIPIPTISVNRSDNQRDIAPAKQNLRAVRRRDCTAPNYSYGPHRNYILCKPIYENLALNVPSHTPGMHFVENSNLHWPYLYPPPMPPPPMPPPSMPPPSMPPPSMPPPSMPPPSMPPSSRPPPSMPPPSMPSPSMPPPSMPPPSIPPSSRPPPSMTSPSILQSPPNNLQQNLNQPVYTTQNVEGSTIIGMNKSGVVRKINICALPRKNPQNTTQQNYINQPDTTLAKTKNEMLEELSKVIMFEDTVENNLKRPFPEAVRYPEINKALTNIQRITPDNLSKKPKLHTTLPKKSVVPDKNNVTIPSHKGYSPPILPIPTYEKTFEILAKVPESQTSLKNPVDMPNLIFEKTPQFPCRNVNRNKRPQFTLEDDAKDKSVKKISLHEYKKRVCKNDRSLTEEGLFKGDRIKIEYTKDDANHNSELDLGYDSDSTVKL